MRNLALILCLCLVGCKSSEKQSTRNEDELFLGDSAVASREDRTNRNPTFDQRKRQGVLAGQVIDERDRRVSNAKVRIVPVSNSNNARLAPVDFERTANREGFFAISDLRPGTIYQLQAQVDVNGTRYSGITTARAPDPRITIRLTKAEVIESGSAPTPRTPAATIERPRPFEEPAPVESTPSTDRRGPPAPTFSDPAPIYPKKDPVPLDRTVVIPPLGSKEKTTVPARKLPIPSCQRLGRSIKSFALRDIHGKPWIYPKNAQGKLVLLDFWHSTCGFCFKASPMISRLQQKYGRYGLEVVGIACERAPSPKREQQVIAALSKHPMSYRILMSGYRGANDPCPLQTQLAVSRFPTLVLLDENGTIVWRSEGLSQQRYRELERVVYQKLIKR